MKEGLSLTKACEFEGMPSHSTFCRWMDDDKELANHYARAREIRADLLFEQMFDIANNERETTITTETANGITRTTRDNEQRSKLQIDAIKWAIARMAPKKYGEKLDLTTDGEKITPTAPLSNELIEKLIDKL